MSSYKKIFTHWRVILLMVFLLFSVLAIKPQVFGNDGVIINSVGQNASIAQQGLQNPASTLPPLSREKIIAINSDKIFTIEDFVNAESKLDPQKIIRVETTKKTYNFLPDTLDGKTTLNLRVSSAPSSNLKKGLDLAGGTRVLLEFQEKVSQEDLDTTVASLQERLNVYGLSDVIVRPAKDLQGTNFILVEIAGVTEEEVKELLSKQGKFEANIANQTVFRGGKKDITYVCRSADCSGVGGQGGACFRSGEGYSCRFFFAITLSPDAADQQALATQNLDVVGGPNGYLSEPLVLMLDDVEVDSLNIGVDLKGSKTTQIQISGSGVGPTEQDAIKTAQQNMKRLQTILLTGSLPVKLEIVKMDTISSSLGKEFLDNVFLVALLVVLAVSSVVFIRYRKIKIVLPMILTLFSEVILILGFAAFVGWNLDLAAIAGIIIVMGTGVDHLIVITDESMRGQEETNWKKRLKNAMFIVMGAYLTTVSGMLPLYWAGAGLLKGFALTTIAGITFGVLVARPAFAVVIEELIGNKDE
ncbi:hypothetical protein HQ489_05985 [Candidatus Woesearchaeota archaeon]|nr:hypothetical protein [Candidatus Woesearchaeota archaeon]